MAVASNCASVDIMSTPAQLLAAATYRQKNKDALSLRRDEKKLTSVRRAQRDDSASNVRTPVKKGSDIKKDEDYCRTRRQELGLLPLVPEPSPWRKHSVVAATAVRTQFTSPVANPAT